VAQAVRPELLTRADPGGAGQAAHQLPEVPLAEPPAGGGQQGSVSCRQPGTPAL
jgi:hypothetical protein